MSNIDLQVGSGQDTPPVDAEVVVPGNPNVLRVVDEVVNALGDSVVAAEVMVIEPVDQPAAPL